MASAPPSIPHSEGNARKGKKQRVNGGKNKPPLPPIIADPLPYHLLNNEEVLIASKLPEGFPPELAFRALAAYSLIRTLSIELRLSPFSPNAFLRALILPCPNILLGKVHVALLRVLLPALKMGYSYSERGRGLCVSKRRRDGVWWDLRGGDNLTYMDALTWPLFYDDYVHLTADHLWKMMNDPELHYGSNNVALQSTDEEEQKLATEREDVPRTSNVAFQNRLDRYLPGIEVEHSPLKSRRPRAEQISPPSRGDSDVDVEIDSGSEFGGSDVEEEDDDEEYGVKNRVKWSRGPPSGTERPRGRPRGSASKSIASASGNGTVRVPLKPNLAPGSRVISADISVLPGVLVSLLAKTSPEVLKAERERFLPKKSSSSSQPMKGELATQLSIQGSGIKRSLPRYPNRQQVQQPAITTDEPSAKRTKVSYTNGNANRVHVPPPVQPAYHLPGQIDSRYPLSTAAKPIPPCAAKNLSGTTAQLKEPPKPFPGAMGMVPGFMYAPYSMTQPLMPAPCPHMIKGVPALHSQTTRPYSQIVAEKRPKLNAIVGETKLPVLDPVEQNVGTHNSISPDIAIAIQRYQMSDGGTCIETNPLGSEKPDTEVATLPQQEDSTGITEGPVATQTNRTESAAKAIRLPAGSAKGEVSAFLPDTYEWPQFSSINYMRSGIPHHRLPLEEKLRIMEFLLDELLTVDTISMEFERRRHKTSAYHYPYGPLPSSHELESLSNEDECGLCRKEGELVCCDGCVRSYHSYCIGLPTGERLPDKWLCPECVTVDPCHFGPLLGGQKSSLDWFTLRDLKVPVGMNVHPVSDETEFLVVHGFVFTRPCSKSREVSSKSKENEVYESHHYSPSSQDDLYRILQMIGPDACSSWPFSQIPMDPTKIWMHVNEPTRTQQMVRYFSQRESFDPTAYLNLYRMAPLSASLQAKGSKKTVLLLSDYESECGSSDVRNLKKMLSRDMSHDMGIARCLRSSTILYNPYEMIISFVLRLEASFRRGCLLDENWGIRNGVYNPQQWPKEMRQCRSLKKIAKKVVHLVDSCHVRVFERGWTDRASSSIGSKTLMRDTGVSSASNDGRRYETLSEDWTFSGEMARRRWRRARDSNVLSLLSRESFHLDGSAHTAESVALKFARTKRKKDGASKKDNEVWKSATFDTDNSIVQLSDNGDPPPSVEAKSTAGRCSNGIANQIPSSTLSVPRTTAKDHSSIEMESVAMSPQQTRETNKKATTTIASKIGSTARDSEHEALTAGPAVDMEEEHQQRAMSPGSSCLQPTETKNMPLSANSKTNEAIIPDKSPQSSLLSSDLAKIPPAVLEGMLHPPSRTNDIELIGTSDISRVESAMTENKERTQKYLAPNPTVFGAKEIVTAMKSKEVVSSIERNGAIRTIDDQYKQIVVEPTIVKSKNENDLLSEARKKKQATRTERSKKSRSAEQSAKGRRRSGRLNHRNDFSNQMDSLVTGSDHVQESSSEQYIHHSDGQFDHTILVDSERKRRLGRLEDLVTNPSPEELEWPVAGRKLFDPLGYLPPAEMRRLGRNAGLVTAQFVQYTTYEVGEVSAFHAWRKRMLRVNSLEDLILQIRVLNSFIDKQVRSCGHVRPALMLSLTLSLDSVFLRVPCSSHSKG